MDRKSGSMTELNVETDKRTSSVRSGSMLDKGQIKLQISGEDFSK